jgi:protocatechuate 3,4-dioxygenase beta subunit
VKNERSQPVRRQILLSGLAGAGALLLGCGTRSQSLLLDPSAKPHGCAPRGYTAARAPASAVALPPPPAGCQHATAANIEGPFFRPGAPLRDVLAGDGVPGARLHLSCRVMSVGCAPVRGARVEVWHADHQGAYDNRGFDFRATLVSDGDGAFDLETIVPGRYLNGSRYRPAHIHVKIHAAGHAPLTTQLYFAGDPYNEGDPFIDPSLIMTLGQTGAGSAAAFDFVLSRA